MAQQKQAAGRKTAKTATVVKAGKGIAAKAVKPPAPRGQKSDAALYYISAGYTTVGKELYGIQAASEGVMRAIARYAGLPRFPAVTHSNEESAVFADTIKKLNPALETVRIHPMATAPLADVGTLLVPGPVLDNFAWSRRLVDSRGWSIVGVTHATSTEIVMDGLVSMAVAPVEPWDAIVCTSNAVRSNVLWMIEQQEAHLTERFGKLKFRRPQLPMIPLGIECRDFARSDELRTQGRQRLGIGPDDVVLLWVGRMSHNTKAHPMPIFLAAERAAREFGKPLFLLMAGWWGDTATEQAYRAAAHTLCPNVRCAFVDGRLPDVRKSIWSLGDIFVSPVDNIQESFGLTPLEAMAAGLPVVASDWDGYRDTVRHGVDGFLIPTYAPGPGLGRELGQGLANKQMNYDAYLGTVAQHVVVDIPAMADAILTLARDAGLRRRMGAAGYKRARGEYEWRVIIGRYRDLWRDLAEMRAKAPVRKLRKLETKPACPDPFDAFHSYPTDKPGETHRIVAGALPAGRIAEVRQSQIVAPNNPFLPPVEEAARLSACADGRTIGEALDRLPPPRRRDAMRSVMWLAKYDFIVILPPAKKVVARKAMARKAMAKKAMARKAMVAKKAVATKHVATKPVAKKPVAKKPVAKGKAVARRR